eukprot:TRINITY_DN94481_c0_g1_i1.p1 TRINITY_DN94481_c0_g1~~TRINITY_DN94481_c0_g1_i1.p1  ORF type:complete len:305 (-),score=74.65 TRINITY_DN94481_c0_g1_i1:198-1112(-)
MTTSVFVRGFDFGTTEEDVAEHCSQAGAVVSTEMWGKGAAVVTYSKAGEAKAAVKLLNQSTIGSNTRYIDVKLNDEAKGSKGKSAPVAKKRAASSSAGGSCRVFARGFDFGTTDEQFEGHMSSAGTIEKVHWVTKGSAIVVYSSPEEAEKAVDMLHQTTIEGNSRYIDVLLKEEEEDRPPAKKAKTAPAGSHGGAWVFVPHAGKASGKGGSKGGGKRGGPKGKEDPAGSGRVFVRGFDFGTDDNQFLNHMKKAGPIHTVHWVTKGSAVVVYRTKAAAVKASNILNGTTIAGNSRFMDVILKDTE